MTLILAPLESIITRTINAPRELVFEAWTNPEHLAKWFGPRIFTAEAEVDPREGGAYRLAMIGTDKAPPEFKGPYPIKGVYKEFKRPERLVYTEDLTEHPQDWKALIKGKIRNYEGEDFLHAVNIVTFEDYSGKTKLTILTKFTTDGIRDAFVETGMKEGWAESLDKLEELLKAK